jgi:hypothetical protein
MIKDNIKVFIIGISSIVAFWVVGNAYKYKFKSTETIVVTGLSEKDFTSDQIVWKGTFNRSGSDLKSIYAMLKDDEVVIKNYLKGKGIPDSCIVFSSIDVQKMFDSKYDDNGKYIGTAFKGNTLVGEVTIDSKDISKVEKVSREVTELLQSGIEFNSKQPLYYYSKLNDIKIDLLANASADAKLRAETIAKNSGVSIGNLKKATMGVFQITGKNSNEDYSYGGVFNTSSKEKTASVTLRAEFIVN